MDAIFHAERHALSLRLLAVAAIAAGLYVRREEIAQLLIPAVVLVTVYLGYVLSLKTFLPLIRTKYIVFGMILIDSLVLILALHMVGGLESNLFILFPVFVMLYSLYLDYLSSFFAASVISASLVIYALTTKTVSSATSAALVYQVPLLFLLAYFSGFLARRASEVGKRLEALEGMGSAETEMRGLEEMVTDVVASGAEGGLPELRRHAAPDGTVTILFTDIEGSSTMMERLGDLRWMEVLNRHNAIVRRQVAEYGGFEVKSQGDGFMLAFQSARRAILCAISIQKGLAAYNDAHPEEPLHVRMGLHVGDAFGDAGDFYGRSVILAARISDLAQGGQILASRLMKELTESAGDIRFENGRDVELRGLAGVHGVFEVVW